MMNRSRCARERVMKIARAMMRMRKRAIATTIPSGTTRIAAPTTDVHGSQKKQTRAARSRAFRVRSRAPWWPRTHARRPAVAATLVILVPKRMAMNKKVLVARVQCPPTRMAATAAVAAMRHPLRNLNGKRLEMERAAQRMVDQVPLRRLLMKVCQQRIAGKHVLKARSVKAMRRIRKESANYMRKDWQKSTATRISHATINKVLVARVRCP